MPHDYAAGNADGYAAGHAVGYDEGYADAELDRLGDDEPIPFTITEAGLAELARSDG